MASLNELRELIGAQTFQRAWWPHSSLRSGIPQGAITQVAGAGKTEFVVRFLAENPQLRAAWVEKEFSIYPCGIIQRHVQLQRILFVEAGTVAQTIWSVLQILRSQLFQVVVADVPTPELKVLRRLQLASEKAGAALIMLDERLANAWPIQLQVSAYREKIFSSAEAKAVKQRMQNDERF
ncbi:MAG: hypothetical protein H6626_11300 [Pseudobdellovibrionaceae bacterium]|nr:hypothetical protein [Bdellovibrionales bacterium]USN46786.1 MAG: hypothetical protein H6626_11300 [Pseudobdellovibrionaceae bacterium]